LWLIGIMLWHYMDGTIPYLSFKLQNMSYNKFSSYGPD